MNLRYHVYYVYNIHAYVEVYTVRMYGMGWREVCTRARPGWTKGTIFESA
jgi:hypothetical protein